MAQDELRGKKTSKKKLSVACTHRLMLGWEEGPLVSCKGPFQGRASAGSHCGKAEGDVRMDRAELHTAGTASASGAS